MGGSRGQAGHSYALTSSVLFFFQRDQPSQWLLHFAGLLPTAPAETLQNGFPPALPQHRIWQRTRHLLWKAANPLGSLLCSCCTGFQKKRGRDKKKWKKKNPCQAAPVQLEEAGSAELAGEDPSTGHWLKPVHSKAMTPSLPQALPNPPEPGLAWHQGFGFWFLHSCTAGSLRNCLLTLHTAS